MRCIASCSFGKDSLAAIITRMEHGEPVDGAVYCRIMFDKETSAEFPDHEEWIHTHAIPLLKARYGIETTIVQSARTYCDCFYSVYKKGGKVGRIYGYPFLRGPWCNNLLKTGTINKWKRTAGEYGAIVGIAADESKRIGTARKKGQTLPLVDHGITEAEAFDICKRADLLSPAYNGGRCRLGCWFCHNQRIGELRRLRVGYPDLWSKLLALDKDSPVTFKPPPRRWRPGVTVRDLDNRFFNESAQMGFEDDDLAIT